MRRRIQIHLSTALWLTLVAATLLWLNVGLESFGIYGWPMNVFSYDFTYFDGVIGGYHVTPTQGDWLRLLVDVHVCLFVLFAVALTCERRIARRAVWCKIRTRTLVWLAVVGGIGILYNIDQPVNYYYRDENMAGPMLMRILSVVAALFLARFFSEELQSSKIQ